MPGSNLVLGWFFRYNDKKPDGRNPMNGKKWVITAVISVGVLTMWVNSLYITQDNADALRDRE